MPVLRAQVVTTQPAVFQAYTPVTILFDATQGNAALANYTGDVYIWTGVVTDSPTGTQWSNVKSPSFNQPDPAAKMTRVSANTYSITFTPNTFYPIPAGTTIYRLAMIFKNADGSLVGRGPAGDIYVNVAQDAFNLRFTSPSGPGATYVPLNTATTVTGTSAVATNLALFLDGAKIAEQANATTISGNVTLTQAGSHTLRLTATSGTTTASTELALQTRDVVTVAALPTGAKRDGVTYLNNGTSAVLSLTAPNKQFVHVIGEFNNWTTSASSYLKRTPNASGAADNSVDGRWWVQIDGLTPGQEYAYQFLVDGELRVADPYTEKVLDPSNDQSINTASYTVYPGLKAYPTGRTTGIVSVLQSNAPAYTWQTATFQRPARTDMVIYELLPRDFVSRHDYKTLTDTLTYLKRLGVNVIELMPPTEFEGNESWGYNVSFYFAPDKYYGPKNELKRFIDECHKRGIAVVLDIVLNQSFGQSPMVQMYFDNGKPAANNPWFNTDAKHLANVGYDFNHESPFTRYFSKRVIEHWLREYHVDGYRFDLSKGFTQKATTTYEEWAVYDQSRVDIWKDYHDFQVSVDATSYPILEHFGGNDEEKVLSDMGMMLWGEMTYNYNEATMGYVGNSNFSYGYYGSTTQGGRGWSQPNLVTFMESHDKERLTYKNEAFGNAAGSYNIKDIPTALARQELAAAFFFPVPGPKMIWQFGELGYDKSIMQCPDGTIPTPYPDNESCKLSNKPILWNYYQDANRRHLYDVYRSLIALKVQEPAFENPASFTQSLNGAVKTMHLTDPRLNVTVVGNFDVQSATVVPNFQAAGTWYNYLTGEAITVTNPAAPLTLAPGQYAVYTSRKITVPAGTVLATKAQRAAAALQLVALPNPAGNSAQLRYTLPQATTVQVTITNLLGATVQTLPAARQAAGAQEVALPLHNLASGVYIVQLTTGQQQQSVRLVVQK
ncbi:T9SS type A sorting domain-containing protein [Hymenobacter sp. HSC-4F20]|nr:T9SS type A sorting domain-containing protein [Hymenobacter sp. HSC-4F20]